MKEKKKNENTAEAHAETADVRKCHAYLNDSPWRHLISDTGKPWKAQFPNIETA